MLGTIVAEMKPTVGLTGFTMNAMALIAPGATALAVPRSSTGLVNDLRFEHDQ